MLDLHENICSCQAACRQCNTGAVISRSDASTGDQRTQPFFEGRPGCQWGTGTHTSIRMHAEVSFSQCVFACPCSEDVLTHYLQCPVLWCLAREISGINELSCSIDARLSLAEPRPDQLIWLAFCHSIYHICINDRECVSLSLAGNQASLQRRVVSFGRQLSHMIVR